MITTLLLILTPILNTSCKCFTLIAKKEMRDFSFELLRGFYCEMSLQKRWVLSIQQWKDKNNLIVSENLWRLHVQFSHHTFFQCNECDFLLTLLRKTKRSKQCSDVFWLKRCCQCVWELHPCSISGLWAVVCSVCEPSVSFLFAFWFLSFSHCCLLAGCCSGLHVVL